MSLQPFFMSSLMVLTRKHACGMHTWHTKDTIYTWYMLNGNLFLIPMWILITALYSLMQQSVHNTCHVTTNFAILQDSSKKTLQSTMVMLKWKFPDKHSLKGMLCMRICNHAWSIISEHNQSVNNWFYDSLTLWFFQVFPVLVTVTIQMRPCWKPRPSPWTFGRPGMGVQVWHLEVTRFP